MKTFSIKEAFKFSSAAFIDNFFLFAKLFLVEIALMLLAGLALVVSGLLLHKSYMIVSSAHILFTAFVIMWGTFLLGLGLFLLFLPIGGTVRVALNIYDTGTAQVADLFKEWRLTMRVAIGSFIYLLGILLGLILLIAPGLFWMTIFWFYMPAMIDKKLGIFESFKYSYKISYELGWQLLWLFLCFLFIHILVSRFAIWIVSPIILLVDIYIYRKLSK